MKNIILTLLITLSLAAVTNSFAKSNKQIAKMNKLVTFMEGTFNSELKYSALPNGENAGLKTTPIWGNKKNAAGKWIYAEHLNTSSLTSPCCQRIYNLTQINDSIYVSVVYTLPHGNLYAGAYKDANALANLNPENLSMKNGCEVFLVYCNKDNQFSIGGSKGTPHHINPAILSQNNNLENSKNLSASAIELK